MFIDFKPMPVFTLVISIVIFFVAISRFVASLYTAYPSFAEERIENEGIQLADEAYSELTNSIISANNWISSPYNKQLQSRIQTNQYISKVDQLTDAQKKHFLTEIEVAIIDGLKLSPIDAFAWYRLALSRKDQQKSVREILEPLKMSILLQRMAPELLIRRIALLLEYKNTLDGYTKEMLLSQIRLAGQFKGGQLARLVAQHLGEKALFSQAFINNPEQWQKLDKSIEQIVKQNHQAQQPS